MTTLFFVAIMIIAPLAGIFAVIGLFRWLIKHFTGYDPSYSDEAIIEGHHVYMKKDVNFAQLNDWDHETGFVNKDARHKRKPRKSKSTPHYDRLHAQEQADIATETLNDLALDDHAEPIPLHELVKNGEIEKRKRQS